MQNTYWLGHSQAVDGAVLASLLGEEKTHADAYWAYLELTWMPLALAGHDAQAKTAFAKLQSLYEAHRLGVDSTVAVASAWADARFMDLSTTKQRMVWVLSIVAGLCIAIALVLFFVVGRRISNMLGAEPAELHREMLRLAKGDLAPSKRTADQRSVYGALQMAQESLQAQLIKTEHTNQELQKTLVELNHLVGTDLLTGLWSRRRMEDTLVGEMDRHRRYGQPLSMLVIDVDAFKAVNDQFGHAIGDEVLVKLAAHRRCPELSCRFESVVMNIMLPS
jgi:predicted signal transduction protein with EAL and GGDEF domain